MDSNDIEQERGITILSKSTSVIHNDVKMNIVDTPGHQDFGGEVERIVLQKALSRGLKPIVVINKVDRPTSRLDEVESEIFDLFCNLDASDDQLEYPTIYASAKNGWAIKSMDDK